MQSVAQNKLWKKAFGTQEESLMRLKWAFFGTLFFYLAAHGFMCFNYLPRHDTLSHLDHFADGWEVSLGRYAQLLWGQVRGEYITPWISGILTVVFMSGATFLISELLEMKNRWAVLLGSGLLSVNITMLALHYNYLYYTDTYALTMLLACAGAFLLVRHPSVCGLCGAAACIVFVMALYQSYILVTAVLLMFMVMKHALQDSRFVRSNIRQYLLWGAVLLAAAVIYFVIYRIMLSVYGITPANTYNSPASLSGMKLTELLPFVRHAYSSFAVYFLGFRQPFSLVYAANILLLVAGVASAVCCIVRKRLPLLNLIVVGVGFVLFPAFGQVMSILSRMRFTHFLTAHALFLMYPGLLALLQSELKRPMIRGAALCLCGVVLFAGIRTANECYGYLKVQYDATLLHTTRIMAEIDHTPEYVTNETPIIIVGELGNAIEGLEPPEECRWLIGNSSAAATYTQSLKMLIHAMGQPMNILHDDPLSYEYSQREDVKAMPAYPAEGYCQLIDGVLVINFVP